MRKNENKTSKFVCIVLLLCVIAMILVAGTYAKYTSSASGSDSATVAKWDIKVNGTQLGVENATVNFDLFGTSDDDLVYPGKTNSFDVVVTNDSQVAATYDIDFTVSGATLPIEYSIDGTNWSTDGDDLDLSSKAIAVDGEVTETVQWRWADDGSRDAADTQLGIDNGTVTVTATITVNQAN